MLPPDVELVVSHYLHDDPDVTDVVSRIGTRHPKAFTDPWVLITTIDERRGDLRSTALHLDDALVQIDVYAGATGGQREASLIARTIRVSLQDMPNHPHDQAVVTRVTSAMRRLPDTGFEPARERYILDATLALHPLPVAS